MHKLTQMHIEAARNSSDDFNLFHDKLRWDLIKNNPFEGPIALGFQLGCFIETQADKLRKDNGEAELIDQKQLDISGYELTFAGSVKPEDSISLTLKRGRLKSEGEFEQLNNRLMLISEKKPVIIGYKKEMRDFPKILPFEFPSFDAVKNLSDRSFIQNEDFFVKMKYMILGNAKNFLSSAFAEQSEYIDEFEDKISFPQMYPLGLLSSALLERAQADGQDLKLNPMIYVTQQLHIDKQQLAKLRSNDKIIIVVSKEIVNQDQTQDIRSYYCLAYAPNSEKLYQARVDLMPLSEILKRAD